MLVMTWSGVRIMAVWHWLERYGVDPVVYAMVDLGSSVPYAMASARTVGALVDRRYRLAARWGLVGAMCFIAPDLYIVASGQRMPWTVYAVILMILVVAAGLAVSTGRSDVADGRQRMLQEAGEPDVSPVIGGSH